MQKLHKTKNLSAATLCIPLCVLSAHEYIFAYMCVCAIMFTVHLICHLLTSNKEQYLTDPGVSVSTQRREILKKNE